MIKVYQATREMFHEVCCLRGAALVDYVVKHLEDYELVARVTTDDFEVAWTLTNSFDSPWFVGGDSRLEVAGTRCAYRSTSIGDIIQHGSKIYVADTVGFTFVMDFKGL